MKRTALLLTMTVFGLVLSQPARAQKSAQKSIAETAADAGNFKTLVAAVKAAGLIETLAGQGPFTVLAPTDEAFAKLPDGTVEALLKPENKQKLISILKLHVASGELTSDMAKPGGEFPTLEGTPLEVNVEGEKITLGSAAVVKADIACSNGVIHVIDAVILPPSSVNPDAIVGTWNYTKAIKNGEARTAEDLKDQTVKITKDSWTLDGEAKFVMDYEIKSETTPKQIKFTITQSPFGAGMSTGGVIKMEDDQLVVAYAATGGDAPKSFTSEPGSGVNVFYLKRAK